MFEFEIKEVANSSFTIHPEEKKDNLWIVWNIGEGTNLILDDNELSISKNCIVFISEFYMKVSAKKGSFRIFKFDKSFLSPVETLESSGEFLMIFYGLHSLHSLPKITLNKTEANTFEIIWDQLKMESSAGENPIVKALKRNSLQRLLLLSQKIHMQTEFDIPIDFKDLKIIREFQYLVNNNFKELTKVADYANILMISPKKVSELFGCCYHMKPSEIIASRRNLFAKHQLRHTNELIKNIAYDLNFSDVQTFSHFFKKQNGISPDEYRSSFKSS